MIWVPPQLIREKDQMIQMPDRLQEVPDQLEWVSLQMYILELHLKEEFLQLEILEDHLKEEFLQNEILEDHLKERFLQLEEVFLQNEKVLLQLKRYFFHVDKLLLQMEEGALQMIGGPDQLAIGRYRVERGDLGVGEVFKLPVTYQRVIRGGRKRLRFGANLPLFAPLPIIFDFRFR